MEDKKKISRTLTAEQKIKVLRHVMATPEFAKMAKETEAMTPVERANFVTRVKDGGEQTKVKIADCPESDYTGPIVVYWIVIELMAAIAVVGLVVVGVIVVTAGDGVDVPDAGPIGIEGDAGVPDA